MYKHILVPVDGSEPSNGALRTAISLSKEMGARIRLLHVVDRAVYLAGYDPSGGVSADMFATLRDSGYRILRDAATAAISSCSGRTDAAVQAVSCWVVVRSRSFGYLQCQSWLCASARKPIYLKAAE